MFIVSTIGQSINFSQSIKNIDCIINQGGKVFRFNLTKYNSYEEMYLIASKISHLKEIFGDDFKVMLDLPFPKKKPRLFIDGYSMNIIAHRRYLVSSDNTSNSIRIDVEHIGEKIAEGDILTYDGGKGSFCIETILNSDTISVKANSDFVIYNKKSLSNYSLLAFNKPDANHISLVNDISPNYIALSFVEHEKEAEFYRQLFNKSEIISKIETEYAIHNIERISKASNVMIARGDLKVYANPYDMFSIQDRIGKTVQKQKKHLYIATDILDSLCRSEIPSSSDLIDLSYILSLNPTGVVLNATLVSKKAKEAFRFIYEMVS